jgi:hypothetical protein
MVKARLPQFAENKTSTIYASDFLTFPMVKARLPHLVENKKEHLISKCSFLFSLAVW